MIDIDASSIYLLHELKVAYEFNNEFSGSPFSVIVSEIGVPDHHPIVSVMDDDGLCSAVNCPAKLVCMDSITSLPPSVAFALL